MHWRMLHPQQIPKHGQQGQGDHLNIRGHLITYTLEQHIAILTPKTAFQALDLNFSIWIKAIRWTTCSNCSTTQYLYGEVQYGTILLNPPDKPSCFVLMKKRLERWSAPTHFASVVVVVLPRLRTRGCVRHGILLLFLRCTTFPAHDPPHCRRYWPAPPSPEPCSLLLNILSAAFLIMAEPTSPHHQQLLFTHKPPKSIAGCYVAHAFHLHFTPTGSSWLNIVQRFSLVSLQRPFAAVVSLRCGNSSRH